MNNIKNIIIGVAIIIVLVLLLMGAMFKINSLKHNLKTMIQNYDAVNTTLQVTKINDSTTLYRVRQETLTAKQLANTKSEELKKALQLADNLKIKTRKLEYLLNLKADTTYDTTVVIQHDSIPGTTIYRDIDHLVIGKLTIDRVQVVGENKAKYTVSYKPTLTIFVHHQKVGKWRLRNLFHKRDIETLVDVISDDALLNFKSIRGIKVN